MEHALNRFRSSVSFLTESSRYRMVILTLELSRANVDARSKISTQMYSMAAARQMGEFAVIIMLEYPKSLKNFSAMEGGNISPERSWRVLPLTFVSDDLVIALDAAEFAFIANSFGKSMDMALCTSLSDKVFFLETSVRFLDSSAMILLRLQRKLLSCCFELEVIPVFSVIGFKLLEI